MRIFLFFSFVFCLLGAPLMTYGGSQARGTIRAVTATATATWNPSQPHLRPIPQLTATPDPYPLSKARDRTHVLMDASQVH